MIYRIEARIRTSVEDTEMTDRVVEAVENVFPEAEVERRPRAVVGTTRSLDHLSEALHRQEILDTARGEFFANRRGDTFSFALKKQAAYEGVVNFSVGEPDELGEIEVEVRVEEPDVESFVDHIAPPTEDGQPIDPD